MSFKQADNVLTQVLDTLFYYLLSADLATETTINEDRVSVLETCYNNWCIIYNAGVTI